MTRVLVVEDERDLAEGLRRSLVAEGYDVEVARTGARALVVARERPFDLIILDVVLPGLDGFGVLGALRARGDDTAVLVLTARDTETDTLNGFRLGADDYVAKPFRLLELLARVRALLKRRMAGPRAAVAAPAPRYTFGDIVVDTGNRTVTRRREPIALRPKEYELLVALLRRDGQVVARSELLREVWGYGPLVSSRTVDTHVLELRRKIEDDPAVPRYIVTARTRGYRFVR